MAIFPPQDRTCSLSNLSPSPGKRLIWPRLNSEGGHPAASWSASRWSIVAPAAALRPFARERKGAWPGSTNHQTVGWLATNSAEYNGGRLIIIIMTMIVFLFWPPAPLVGRAPDGEAHSAILSLSSSSSSSSDHQRLSWPNRRQVLMSGACNHCNDRPTDRPTGEANWNRLEWSQSPARRAGRRRHWHWLDNNSNTAATNSITCPLGWPLEFTERLGRARFSEPINKLFSLSLGGSAQFNDQRPSILATATATTTTIFMTYEAHATLSSANPGARSLAWITHHDGRRASERAAAA